MAYIIKASRLCRQVVMAYIVMAYIVMACRLGRTIMRAVLAGWARHCKVGARRERLVRKVRRPIEP